MIFYSSIAVIEGKIFDGYFIFELVSTVNYK
jgi:hypothetical protein